jgi:hypothetical protein
MDDKVTCQELESRLKDLRTGDHLCCIYESEEEHQALLTPYLRQGLEKGEKVLYVVDAHKEEEIINYLRDDGVEVETFLASGQLVMLTPYETYKREESFNPDKMIGLLREETERSLNEGYSALRATGEMTWALRDPRDSDLLIEYEAKLNDFFAVNKCLAICQYDRRRFESSLLLNVLATHPIVINGTEVFENFFYVPPKDLFGPNPDKAKLDTLLADLNYRKRVEIGLDEHSRNLERIIEERIEELNKALYYSKEAMDEIDDVLKSDTDDVI